MKKFHPSGFVLSASLALALLTLLLAVAGTAAGQPASATLIVTNTNDSGPGSLRQAILDVDRGETILFDPSLAGGTIVLTSGQLVISRSLTIDASAAISLTVDGNRADRVFYIVEDTVVELIALTITGGQAPVNGEETIGHGGGILNLGELTLTGCTVLENRAGHGRGTEPPYPIPSTLPGGDGGGIYNAGRLILHETTVISNTAGAGGWSYFGYVPASPGGNGGGLFNSGVLEISDSAVLANRGGAGGGGFPDVSRGPGGHGGGVYSTGPLTISRSSLTGNMAGNGYFREWEPSYTLWLGSPGGDGGGIYSAESGRLTMIDCTVDSNDAGSGQNTADHPGGAGGGLYSSGMAWIANSAFVSNSAADCQGIGGVGGAIANDGTLLLQDAMLDGNSSGTSFDGGRGGHGGGLWNQGVAHMTDSVITNNRASRGSDGMIGQWHGNVGTPGGQGGDGAGIWSDGSLMLLRVTVDGNQAGDGGLGGRTEPGAGLAGGDGGSGGGLWNGGQLAVFQTTISHNRAGAAGSGGDGASPRDTGGSAGQGGDGGGLVNQDLAALINSTVSGNAAGSGGAGGSATVAGDGGDGGRGGGVYNSYSLALDNCTVTGNSTGLAGAGGQGATGGAVGLDGAGGGVYGDFAARDTILAGNNAPGGGPDCAGQLCAGSHNLLQDPAGCTIAPAVANNVIGHSPALLALALNAPGTTATHALVAGSRAIDVGNCSGGTVAYDQRGLPRPYGAGCDIGAYEFDGTTAGRLLWLPHALRGGTP